MLQVEAIVNVAHLEFPVLALDRNAPSVFASPDDLLTTWTPVIRSGFFDGLELIDASGKVFRVDSFRVTRGVGPFWGYRPFLGRRVRVELSISDTSEIAEIGDLRSRIAKLLRLDGTWRSREDFEDLLVLIAHSKSVGDLIRSLGRSRI
jgi:hypothetical protein